MTLIPSPPSISRHCTSFSFGSQRNLDFRAEINKGRFTASNLYQSVKPITNAGAVPRTI